MTNNRNLNIIAKNVPVGMNSCPVVIKPEGEKSVGIILLFLCICI